jgi:Membrane protein involved in the export of O-antigen and teichoic acid
MNDISIKKAAIINFISKYANVFIQVLYTSILARILTPEDFGIVAVTTVFTTFFMLFADMGVGAAVIQNKELTDEDINNIFSFTFYIAIILSALFALFSVPLSIIFNNEVYKPIGIILSISLFFNTLNMVPNAVILKNKRFKTIGVRLVIISISSCTITVFLAKLGLKYYSIVINSVIIAFFTFLWNYSSVKICMRTRFDKSSIKKIMNFSAYQFAFSIFNYFARNLDNLLIGKFMGDTALGYYDKAYRLMLYPITNLTGIFSPVLLPILSEHQNNKKYIFVQYIKVVKLLSLVGIFFTVYCFFAAKEIVLIMFGNQWANSIDSFKLLALSVWVQIINSSSGAIFQSLGKTKLMFISGICTTTISVIAIIIGVSTNNITHVAASVTVAYNLHFFIVFFILIRYGFGYNIWDFFEKIIPDFFVFLITTICFYLITFFKIDNNLLSLIYKGIAGGISYVIALLLTRQYKAFQTLIKRKG